MSPAIPPAAPAGAAAPAHATLPATLADHLPRAHAIARAMLGCDHLAADAVQEAVLALWRQPTPPPDLRGWLGAAVVLRSRHLRRTLRRRTHHEQQHAAHCAAHPHCDNPLHHAYAHELAERCDAAVRALPKTQLVVFQLAQEHDLDYQGLAHRLQLPIGTVRSRLHRARAAVRTALVAPADRD